MQGVVHLITGTGALCSGLGGEVGHRGRIGARNRRSGAARRTCARAWRASLTSRCVPLVPASLKSLAPYAGRRIGGET